MSQSDRWFGRGVEKTAVIRQLLHLLLNGLNDARIGVSDIHAPKSCQPVEQPFPGLIDQITPLPTNDHVGSGLVHCAMIRKRVQMVTTVQVLKFVHDCLFYHSILK
jgi:hypothetical protein